MFDLHIENESPTEEFAKARMECLRRMCRDHRLHIPDGWELIPDGERVLNGDAMIRKSLDTQKSEPYRCFESVGRNVGNQSQTAFDNDCQGGYWFIRKIVNDMPIEERMRNPYEEWSAEQARKEQENRLRYWEMEDAKRLYGG